MAPALSSLNERLIMQSTMPTPKIVRRRRNDSAEVEIPKMEESKEDIVKRVLARRNFKSLAERVAGDSLFYKNYYYPGGRSFFTQQQNELLTVDKYFPYAEGGALYIDEPMFEYEERDCEKKAQAMKVLGLRYLIIKRNMNELDCIEAIA